MSQPQRGAGGGQLDPLAALLAASAGAQQPGRNDIISGLDITRLLQFIEEYHPSRVDDIVKVISAAVQEMAAGARELINGYVRDGLGRLVHPMYASVLVRSRYQVLLNLLGEALRRVWREAREALESGAPPDEVAERVARAQRLTRNVFLIALEAYAYMVTLALLNAPARLRHPLANVALGYDILEPPEERRGLRLPRILPRLFGGGR